MCEEIIYGDDVVLWEWNVLIKKVFKFVKI